MKMGGDYNEGFCAEVKFRKQERRVLKEEAKLDKDTLFGSWNN